MELTKEQILQIHDRQLQKFGGEPGIREEGTFDMLAQAPYQSVFGMDLFPSVFDKAAKFLEGFARHQVFYDGNKRTGVDACLTYLAINNYALTLTPMEVYDLAMKVSNDKDYSIAELSEYLETHSEEKAFSFEGEKDYCE